MLHPLAGRPLLAHVLDTARALSPRKIIVVHGHGAEQVKEAFPDKHIEWVLQAEQLGTAHAVMQAMPRVSADADVLLLYGDVPLVRAATLKRLLEAARAGARRSDRGSRRSGRLRPRRARRLGPRDSASSSSATLPRAERAIREINAGFYALSARRLSGWLKKIDNRNAQKEYYLTDLVGLAVGGRRAGGRGQGRRRLGGGRRQLQARAGAPRAAVPEESVRKDCSKRASRSPTRRASTCAARSTAAATCRST